ncbi:hypothetical protein H9P43_003979 [Blastocladiella emersonii ATCC 22665]|nr:hypothetical protein H9P43_003979 [Blastocladiella emersonii ATCC 22665]
MYELPLNVARAKDALKQCFKDISLHAFQHKALHPSRLVADKIQANVAAEVATALESNRTGLGNMN